MKSVFLVIGFVALLVYGGWLMERLDKYASGSNDRHRGSAGPRRAVRRACRAAARRVAALLPKPEPAQTARAARGIDRRKPRARYALSVMAGNLLRHN